jgi:hypothetical protein
MTSLLVGIYGLYLIAVGVKGNTSTMIGYVQEDAAGFVPWLLIVIVLVSLYDVPALSGFSEAFAVLIILGLIVSSNSQIVSQFKSFYDSLAQPATVATTSTAPTQ